MNSPEINTGNNITAGNNVSAGNAVNSGASSGMNFSNIMGALQQLMMLKQMAQNGGGNMQRSPGGASDQEMVASGQGWGGAADIDDLKRMYGIPNSTQTLVHGVNIR